MIISIDESGSINNRNAKKDPYFIIALIHVIDNEKLKRAYKRFVSANIDRLKELDADRDDGHGHIKAGGKMFQNGKFRELKGSSFDHEMKQKFIEFITRNNYFEVFYIRINNAKLTDKTCENTARVFNYNLCKAIMYFLNRHYIPNEDFILNIDERNERTESKYFLCNYLNTELCTSGIAKGKFTVTYYDSANCYSVQIADIFANLYYSHLKTSNYESVFDMLKDRNILKFVYEFPL